MIARVTNKPLSFGAAAMALMLLLCLIPVLSGQAAASGNAPWVAQTSNTTNTLRKMSAVPSTAGHAWTAGNSGTIRKTSDYGATWSTVTSGTTSNLLALDVTDDNNAWVGAGGNIRHTSNGGTSWSSTSSLTQVRGIDMVTSTTGFAVGTLTVLIIDVPAIFKTTNGTSWSSSLELGGLLSSFDDVWAVDSNVVWVCGSGGLVRRTTNGGSGWDSRDAGSTDLLGIAGVDSNTAWVVGGAGLIRKTTNGGSNWTTETSGTTATLREIIAVDANNVWAVGDGGVILKTSNGGTNWTAQTSGTSTNLNGIGAQDVNTAWAAGASGTILYTDSGGWIPAPVLNSLSISSGTVGTSVTLNGSEFGSTQGNGYVSFGGTQATTYASWSDTQIQCQVPSGASGVVQVTVTHDGGTSSGLSFSVVPNITGRSPTSGTVGTSVTLSGSAFGGTQGASYVSFGSTQATSYTSWADGQIVVAVPAGASGALEITVTTAGGTSAGVAFSVVPYLSAINPTSGFVTSEVTLDGTGFGSSRGSSYVTFGATQATTYTSWTDTQVKALVPVAAPGLLQVTLTTTGGTSNAKDFTVTPYIMTTLETWNQDGSPGGGNIDFGSIYGGAISDNLSPATRLSVTSTVDYTTSVEATGTFTDGAGHAIPWASFLWSVHTASSWTAFSTTGTTCASGVATWPDAVQHSFDYRIYPPANQAPGTYQVVISYITAQQ
ncbi:MAG: IPT/TIG domain-containing protein [Actinobacteria bacterium]|nr:IPT/TIG domain-containing protein [Actinomycetota bacterium]